MHRNLLALLFAAAVAAASASMAQPADEMVRVLPPAPPPSKTPPRVHPQPPCKPVDYPLAALRAEAVGSTYVTVTIGQTGYPTSTTITRSAGNSREHKLLDSTAAQHIWGCRYLDTGTFTVEYVWRLNEVKPEGDPAPAK